MIVDPVVVAGEVAVVPALRTVCVAAIRYVPADAISGGLSRQVPSGAALTVYTVLVPAVLQVTVTVAPGSAFPVTAGTRYAAACWRVSVGAVGVVGVVGAEGSGVGVEGVGGSVGGGPGAGVGVGAGSADAGERGTDCRGAGGVCDTLVPVGTGRE